MNSLLYLNGLSGRERERPFEVRELAKFGTSGIRADHAHIRWDRWWQVEGIVDQLEGKVRELASLGRTSIVGFSAGGSLAIHLLARTRDIEGITATSIAGRLSRGNFNTLSPRHLRHAAHQNPIDPNTVSYPAFYDSVVKLERDVVPKLGDEDKAKITIIKPKHDFVVPLSTMEIEGVETVTVNAHWHQSAGVQGLRFIHERMELLTAIP